MMMTVTVVVVIIDGCISHAPRSISGQAGIERGRGIKPLSFLFLPQEVGIVLVIGP